VFFFLDVVEEEVCDIWVRRLGFEGRIGMRGRHSQETAVLHSKTSSVDV